MDVAALPFDPYWNETIERTEDGRVVKRLSGTDYDLLFAMSQTLNFKINVLNASTWAEVRPSSAS